MNRTQVIRVLADHSLKSTDQTASFNGKMLESGTSFDETFGVLESYQRNQVYAWLGY